MGGEAEYRRKSDSITQARCNQNYLAQHLANIPVPTTVPAPALASFKHTFNSPLWAPDLTGALLLGSAAALLVGLLTGVKWRRQH